MSKSRMIVDALMVMIMPVLMAYSLAGEVLHEVLGVVVFGVFIAHHVLNWKWFTALPKGKYDLRRVVETAVTLLLLVFMFAQPITGVIMSKHLFTFLPETGGESFAREVHLALAYWEFVLMSMHAGTHMGSMIAKIGSGAGANAKAASEVEADGAAMHEPGSEDGIGSAIKVLVISVIALICFYGAYAFFENHFLDYMTLKAKFWMVDLGMNPLVAVGQNLAVMVLFAAAGYVIDTWLRKSQHSGTVSSRQ